MPRSEIKRNAGDRKLGMTLDELRGAVMSMEGCFGKEWKVKAEIGFKGQLQSLTFVEDRG